MSDLTSDDKTEGKSLKQQNQQSKQKQKEIQRKSFALMLKLLK